MSEKNLILYEMYPDFPVKGINFIDLTPSLLEPNITSVIIKQLVELYIDSENVKEEIDYIISPDARGFIWGGMVASNYELGFIPVRKKGKLPDAAVQSTVDYKTEYSAAKICMPNVNIEGKRILFIDDVYATGGTYRAVKQLVNEAKGILIGGAVLVDIELEKTEEVKSLIKSKDLHKW